ncbi:uncharacterized protein F4812DRAFT_440809 [Daldinia caldariorum]|uniref:uncharacterized protein n=1 Tax=Daldinia caldariorum TaxID=326644 RepID=UPI0020077A0C|nr:uncharacterized protein F4812DRAFT_440809 [Daldinia caldariorum]KAI1464878.1 hypothetical protein F4812DRAFT_440809 [Daldinia caldariorum]
MSAVLQPLLDFPGVLTQCELRLHRGKESHITEFAEEMARRIKGAPPNIRKKPFPFLKLPPEIRRNILTYTDLVAPGNEVQWNPNLGFHICRWNDCIHGECKMDRACNKCCYSSCTPRTPRGFFPLQEICLLYDSGYSPSCKCWYPPGPLMLVSRTMYRDACDVFYGCNRIIIHPAVLRWHWIARSTDDGNACPVQLSVSQFIFRYKWPSILSYLRRLEIVFPPIDADAYPEEPHPLYAEWARVIDLLKAHANVANLTIIIHMAFRQSEDFKSTYFEERMRITGNNNDVAFKVHKRLLEPLRTLNEMKRFYVHLEWPWHWSSKALEHPNECRSRCGDCTSCRVNVIESWLERSVMGDEYNSDAIGKLTQRPSYWLIKEWK